MGLVRGDNTPRSSRVVQASSLQNNEPVVLSSVVKRSPGRLERQLWWDPGTRARTRGGGVQRRVFFFFFFREGCEFMESRRPVCCGNPRSPPPAQPHLPLQSFLTPEKRPMRQNCHLQCRSCPGGRKKEAGNQWSCINLLTANVLSHSDSWPLPCRPPPPQTNHHCAIGPHLSPSTLLRGQRCHIRRGKSTSRGFFEERRSNCHLEMCLAGLGPRHNGLKREKSGKGGGWGSGGGGGEPVSVWRTQHLTLVVIVIISQFVSQIWLEWYGKSGREKGECQVTALSDKGEDIWNVSLGTHRTWAMPDGQTTSLFLHEACNELTASSTC